MGTSQSIVFQGAGIPLELADKALPTPGPAQLLVRVTLAGICGSDTHRLRGDIPAPSAPINFGHEAVGVIEAVGSQDIVDSAGAPLQVGDRLYWLPMTKCGNCGACSANRPIVECENLRWPFPAEEPNPAGFQQHALLSQQNYMVRVPEDVTDESLMAFGCALPTALTSFRRIGSVPKSLIVQGAGPVGLATVAVASRAGVQTIITIGDPAPRLLWAERFGAHLTLSLSQTTPEERERAVANATGTRGAEAIIEAAGHPSAIAEGLSLLADSGTYVISGLYSGAGTVPTDFVDINNRNLTIKGCLRNEPQDYVDAVAMAQQASKTLNFGDIIERVYPLREAEDAIRALEQGAVKVVINPQMA